MECRVQLHAAVRQGLRSSSTPRQCHRAWVHMYPSSRGGRPAAMTRLFWSLCCNARFTGRDPSAVLRPQRRSGPRTVLPLAIIATLEVCACKGSPYYANNDHNGSARPVSVGEFRTRRNFAHRHSHIVGCCAVRRRRRLACEQRCLGHCAGQRHRRRWRNQSNIRHPDGALARINGGDPDGHIFKWLGDDDVHNWKTGAAESVVVCEFCNQRRGPVIGTVTLTGPAPQEGAQSTPRERQRSRESARKCDHSPRRHESDIRDPHSRRRYFRERDHHRDASLFGRSDRVLNSCAPGCEECQLRGTRPRAWGPSNYRD